MKRFICFLFIVFAFSSCSLDDSNATKEYYLPVDHIVMASDTINTGETATLTVTYRRPSDCYLFNGYAYGIDGFTRTVLVKCAVLNESDCPTYQQDNLYDVPLNFTPENTGTYTFKFWSGNNENDEPMYIEHEITVENNY